jgi:hypothetical protein
MIKSYILKQLIILCVLPNLKRKMLVLVQVVIHDSSVSVVTSYWLDDRVIEMVMGAFSVRTKWLRH